VALTGVSVFFFFLFFYVLGTSNIPSFFIFRHGLWDFEMGDFDRVSVFFSFFFYVLGTFLMFTLSLS